MQNQKAETPLLAASSGSSSTHDNVIQPPCNGNTGQASSSRLSSRHHYNRRDTPVHNNHINNATSQKITALHAIPYVHGSYASASPTFVHSSKFCRVLHQLLPGAYDELKSLMKSSNNKRSGVSFHDEDTSSSTTRATAAPPPPSRARSDTSLGSNHPTYMKLPDPVKIMKWAENNPVVSAFGIWESDSGRRTVRYPRSSTDVGDIMDASCVVHNNNNNKEDGYDKFYASAAQNAKSAFRRRNTTRQHTNISSQITSNTFEIRPLEHNKPALEWDIFLDPQLVRQVSKAIEVVENLERKIRLLKKKRSKKQLDSRHNSTYSTAILNDEEWDEYDHHQECHTASQIEVDRLVSQLMKRTILAHGSMSQLVLEAVGVAKDYNYNSVVRGVRRSRTRREGVHSFADIETDLFWKNNQQGGEYDWLSTTRGKEDGKTNFMGSRGIYMEDWLSIFSKTLVLLKNETPKRTVKRRRWKENVQREGLRIHDETAQSAQIGQVEGLGGLLNRMWFRKNSSIALDTEREGGHESDNDVDMDYDTTSDGASDDMVPDTMPSLLDVSPRSNDSDAYDDMFSTPKAPTSSLGALCGMTMCLTGDDSPPSAYPRDLNSSHNMSRDIQRISEVLGEPLRLVLDLKSRRVPPKVWARLIDSMRSRGLVVEGIGSFDMDELRVISKSCSCPLTPILFFHSVGDLQRACHANEVKKGDTVYFNGGSLMWKPSTIMEAAERGCCGCIETSDMGDDVEVLSDITLNRPDKHTKSRSNSGKYSFQPYAYPRSSLSDWERVMCKSTLECYQKHFNLKVGVYVQEFSISPEALDALSSFVNAHGALYDQGLAFGGINGVAVKHIHGDGYWNQRYVGRSWDFKARPANHMMPLKPEDHHIVQKAIQAGAWAQVASTYEVTDLALEKREPCNPFLQPGMGF